MGVRTFRNLQPRRRPIGGRPSRAARSRLILRRNPPSLHGAGDGVADPLRNRRRGRSRPIALRNRAIRLRTMAEAETVVVAEVGGIDFLFLRLTPERLTV